MQRFRRLAVVLVVLLTVAGCAQKTDEEPQLSPKIAPPAIGKEATLRAGVDLSHPPFSGEDGEDRAGIDIDVAAALASELGLVLETVDVPASEQATALAGGDVDIMMSVPFTEEVMTNMTLAGAYAVNGSAFFVASEDTATAAAQQLTIADMGGKKVGAQEGSPSYWALEYELGEGGVQAYPTLRAALEALQAGEVDIVAGDAMIAAYIARDLDGVAYAGQLAPGVQLGIGVVPENTELEQAVRTALDKLAADGVLDTIRSKWVGDLPQLQSMETTAAQ